VVEGDTKSSRARRIVLDGPTVAALRDWRVQQAAEREAFGEGWASDGDVWTWQDGSALHPNLISRKHMELAVAAGLPRLSVHKLRHTSATHAIEAGTHVSKVSKRLGHVSVSITMDMYVASTDEGDAEAAGVLAARLYGSDPLPPRPEGAPLRGAQRRKARPRPDSRPSRPRRAQ
jgi:integrase